MSVAAQKETLGFETEVNQLLHLVIHSLYSNKEIFLRELISNASDAADKLRFEALSDDALFEGDSDLCVKIDVDKDNSTITVTDNGIGMTREDVIEHLGTIAKSGTKQFLESLTGDKSKDSNLIGQFGVGFYSAFTVADKVSLETRRAGMNADQGVRWESDGKGSYTIENIDKPVRGTRITLHIKPEDKDFLDHWRLQSIINKYSDHLPLPVFMKEEKVEDKESEEEAKEPEYQKINQATALWTLSKSAIKDDEYKEFYKHVSHDFMEPLCWSHNKVEGKHQYTTLLYIPKQAPFDLYQPETTHGLKLYVQRVFIMDNAEQFLPRYLRFVKGVVDSNDLPLNVSREILQDNKLVETIRKAVSKRVLSTLEKLANHEPQKYQEFWDAFGQVIKEGPAEDFANKEEIANLLRFSTTHTDKSAQTETLKDYVARMKPGQDKIFYITADSFNAARHSPHLEIFRQKGIEVLLLSDRIDEWLVAHLREFDGKALVSVTKGELDLGEVEEEEVKEQQKQTEKDFEALIKRVSDVLKDKVKEVRVTHRLTDSPACIVADEYDIGGNMQRILKAAGQEVPESKPILELNPKHPIVTGLNDEPDDERFNEVSHILLEQSILAEGGTLEDPALFIQRLNKLLIAM